MNIAARMSENEVLRMMIGFLVNGQNKTWRRNPNKLCSNEKNR